MKQKNEKKPDSAQAKRPYEKPQVQRVDLALAETLSSGCKLAGVCDDPFTGTSGAGS